MTQIQSSEEKQIIYDHYAQLIGGKITEVILLNDDTDTESVFDDETRVILTVVKKKQEYLVEVLSDEEGNGTGFLEIIKMNDNEEK